MNAMKTYTSVVPGTYRDLNTVTAELKVLQHQAQALAIQYVIQMGLRLQEAKEMIDDSKEFENWLAQEVNFKKATAYNYMKIAANYGADQASLFGESKPSYEKLNYAQALALLAVPEEEREAFIEENHVEDMSARELKKAIAERDEAIKAKEAAERELDDTKWELEGKLDELRAELEEKPDVEALQERVENAEKVSNDWKKRAETAENEAEKVRAELTMKVSNSTLEMNALKNERDALQKELTEAKNNPDIPEDLLDKIEKEAAERAKAEFEAKLKEAQADQQSAKAEAEALKKKLAQSNEDVAIFRAYLTDATETLNKLKGLLLKIKGREPETAEKLTNAVVKILSDYVGGI